ncbi:hypothetical protein EOPP23_04570 [Endozoicomonas sp. OPT23]|uniref:VOC family protein n=1 Tax=Endozoicomonas sp. OPT23 TaxID=2072845 RepID=UPI00129AC286|nr:VOC family protein [Endozoicomonas sp. OPT23]MRI32267.1 hypothetical protein [Endozoicomonas sp. OPT23]
MDNAEQLGLPPVAHIGFVVPDLEKALEQYRPLFGDFQKHEVQLPPLIFHGKEQRSAINVAIGKSGETEIELIQPVSGNAPHHEFIASGGNGMHHLGFFVDDIDAVVEKAKAYGYEDYWSARFGQGGWTYLKRDGDPLILEIMKR